jgi:hypothetical protein
MRGSLLVVVLASACSALVACGGDDTSVPLSRGPRTAGGTDQPGAGSTDPTGTQPTPASACAGVAEAKQISQEADAGDLRITDGAIFYRAGKKVMRAALDGSGQVPVYESQAMLRSFVGGGFIVTIEDPNAATAVVKVTSLEDPANADPLKAPALEIATNFNAGGSYFIGADADAVYLVGDEAQGEVIYRLAKTAPALQPLVTVTDAISSAQVATDGLWYVRDRSRVFKIGLATPDPNNPDQKLVDEPREIFGSTSTACALAVGQDAAFCSVGAAVERRDLTGANLKTLFEASKSKVAAPFGGPTWFDGTLYVRTSTPDAVNGHALRALKTANGTVEEKIVACGRTAAIGDVAIDKDVVAWTQPDKGVFLAPR